jgi:ribosomal protein S18 acetylase RimI-like enzyme
MKEYTLSPIEPMHIPKIVEVAKKSFGLGVEFIIPKKKIWGFYAHHEGDIGGAVFIKKAGQDEGFLDWIFVDPEAQGHRLGARLMDRALDALKEAGCHTQFALVNDFNTASWNMFAKRGYKQPSVLKSFLGYGLASLPYRFMFSLVDGYSIWVKDEKAIDTPIHPKRFAILKTLLFSLFIGAALSLFSLRGFEYFYVALSMVMITTVLRIALPYLVVRRYGKVRFDAPQGSTVLALILALLGTWWPTFGSWMPAEDFWNAKDFRPFNGWARTISLLLIVVLYALSGWLLPELFESALQFYFGFILMVQLLPVFPLDGMDGAYIYKYNKLLYLAVLIISLTTFIAFF